MLELILRGAVAALEVVGRTELVLEPEMELAVPELEIVLKEDVVVTDGRDVKVDPGDVAVVEGVDAAAMLKGPTLA